MKKTILTLAVTLFIAGTVLTGCQSPNKKVENAQANVQDAKGNVVEANQELDKAINDSVQQFRKDAEAKIIAHNKSIADFKARIANQKMEIKAKYEKQIADLEQKNSDMKKELDNFKAEGKEKWEAFKIKFKHDLDELGKSMKAFSVKGK